MSTTINLPVQRAPFPRSQMLLRLDQTLLPVRALFFLHAGCGVSSAMRPSCRCCLHARHAMSPFERKYAPRIAKRAPFTFYYKASRFILLQTAKWKETCQSFTASPALSPKEQAFQLRVSCMLYCFANYVHRSNVSLSAL